MTAREVSAALVAAAAGDEDDAERHRQAARADRARAAAEDTGDED
ncbi:MAG TPA: hypothetical protein VFV89_18270 [Nocardioides sp.]|nr:hypothetical protein [Nocardioides sp.]HEX5089758.1 hypothetical protein [Nocardioides sp.]